MARSDNKPAIIFLHGSSQSHKVWYRQLNDPQLNEHYRLIALDLPGHGASERFQENFFENYSLRNMAVAAQEAVAQLNVGTYIYVGFSLGTNILAELKKFPENCKGLFMIGASVANKNSRLNELMFPFKYGHILTKAQPDENEIIHYVNGLTYKKRTRDIVMLKDDLKATDPEFRNALANCFTTLGWDNEIENLRHNTFPMCFVFGEKEEIINSLYQKEILSDFADVTIIENAGHLVQLDQPETLNQMLFEFANRCFNTPVQKTNDL